jgi:hypothetical protein
MLDDEVPVAVGIDHSVVVAFGEDLADGHWAARLASRAVEHEDLPCLARPPREAPLVELRNEAMPNTCA